MLDILCISNILGQPNIALGEQISGCDSYVSVYFKV